MQAFATQFFSLYTNFVIYHGTHLQALPRRFDGAVVCLELRARHLLNMMADSTR